MNISYKKFKETIYRYYRDHGRSFPWRPLLKSVASRIDPYHILLSEVMLQQTQADRVVPKYREFLKMFPTIKVLAGAPLRNVLQVWQGLGYNRRAKYLHQTAQLIEKQYSGVIPINPHLLQKLPGVGSYTVGAILAFAYNHPTIFLETNVRSVYIHFFFKNREEVSDREVLEKVEKTMDYENPREWYWALMDYGAMLKRTVPNPSRKSTHYVKQRTFEGSNRQLRGALLRLLLKQPYTAESLKDLVDFPLSQVEYNLDILTKEGFIAKSGQTFHIL